jgi:hypothetical protein
MLSDGIGAVVIVDQNRELKAGIFALRGNPGSYVLTIFPAEDGNVFLGDCRRSGEIVAKNRDDGGDGRGR